MRVLTAIWAQPSPGLVLRACVACGFIVGLLPIYTDWQSIFFSSFLASLSLLNELRQRISRTTFQKRNLWPLARELAPKQRQKLPKQRGEVAGKRRKLLEQLN